MSEDDLRDRLRAMAEEDTPRLSDEARRRVVDAVRERGPAVQRGHARRRRAVTAAAAMTLAGLAAAAVSTIVLPRSPTAEPGVTASSSRRCDAWEAADVAPVAGVFDLGARAVVRLDGEGAVASSDGCSTVVVLREGQVRVHARDLGGGTLRVDAGPVQVEVRGTRFSVSRSGESVEVRVIEGHVVVAASGDREIHLRDGETWSLADGSGGPLAMTDPRPDGEQEADTASAAGVEGEHSAPATPSAEPTDETRAVGRTLPPTGAEASGRSLHEEDATELLTRAEALYRGGRHVEARRLFNEVGARSGPLAEAALVRLSRLELQASNPSAARRAARAQQRRFPEGRLGAEALWLDAEASRALGDAAGRARAAARLHERYPDSPQARVIDSNFGGEGQ